MAETIGKKTGAAEPKASDPLEEAKRQALMSFFGDVSEFMKHDRTMNNLFERVLTAAVELVEKDPRAAFSGAGDIDAILSALKKSEGGVHGADIVGASAFSDVIDLIKQLIDILGKEKDFFLEIIKLIFCGC